MKARWKQLLAVAAIAAVAIALLPDQAVQAKQRHLPPAASSAVQQLTVAQPAAVSAPPVSEASQQHVRLVAEAGADLFASKSWYVAPLPPPPPKPAPPPFPYQFTGSQRDDADAILFLTLGQRNLILREGDLFDGNYRLDDIGDGEAVFTYLPLKQQQRLQIGSNK